MALLAGVGMSASTACTAGDSDDGGPGPAPSAVLTIPFTVSASPVILVGSSSYAAVEGADIESWEWDFGDGMTGTGASQLHDYAAPGTYTVSLTVASEDGASDTASSAIEVVDATAYHGSYRYRSGCWWDNVSTIFPVVTLTNGTIAEAQLYWMFLPATGSGSSAVGALVGATFDLAATFYSGGCPDCIPSVPATGPHPLTIEGAFTAPGIMEGTVLEGFPDAPCDFAATTSTSS